MARHPQPGIPRSGPRLMWRRARLVACALLILPALAAPPLAAQDEPAAQPVRTGTVNAVATTTAGLNGRAAVTVQNTSDEPVAVQVGTTFWFDRASGDAVHEARWVSLPSGEGPREKGTFSLAAKTTATFQVAGTFGQAGVYETYLQVEGSKTVPPQRYTVSITRTVRALPADLLREPRTVELPLGLLGSVWTGGDTHQPRVRVSARNGTSESVEPGLPSAGPIYRTDGSAETAVTGTAVLRPVAGACPNPLPADATCDLDLTLPPGLGAGRYAVDLALNGAQGGQSARTMKFDVRASPWLAAGLVMVGALAGALVSYWREKGGQAVDQLVAAAEVRTLLVRLAHVAPTRPLQAAARALQREVRALEDAILRGGERQAALAALTKRTASLARAEAAVRSAAGTQQAQQRLLANLAARIDAVVSVSDWTDETLDAASSALRSEIESLEDLSEALKGARALDARLQPLVPWLEGTSASEYGAFKEALKRASDPIDLPGTTPAQGASMAQAAQRADSLRRMGKALETSQPKAALSALQAAVDARIAANPPAAEKPALEAFRKRIAGMPAEPSIDTVATLIADADTLGVNRGASALAMEAAASVIPQIMPGDTKAILEADATLLGFGAGESVRSLRAKQSGWNLVTNLLVLLVIGAVGVLTVWLPNPAWGTVFDIIMAFLAGVGTRLAIGTLPAPAR